MLTALLMLLGAVPPPEAACLRIPPAVSRLGEEAEVVYRDGLKPSSRAPGVSSAPHDARLLLRLIWSFASNPTALAGFMEDAFTWSFGGDANSAQALAEWRKDPLLPGKLRAAIAGTCKLDGMTLTCAAKKGPRVVLEKQSGCWRWTAFVAGD